MPRKVVKQDGYSVDAFVALNDESVGDVSDSSDLTDSVDSISDKELATRRLRKKPKQSLPKQDDNRIATTRAQPVNAPATPKIKANDLSFEAGAVIEHGLLTPKPSPGSNGLLIKDEKQSKANVKSELARDAIHDALNFKGAKKEIIYMSDTYSDDTSSAYEPDSSYQASSASSHHSSSDSEPEFITKSINRKRKASSTPARNISSGINKKIAPGRSAVNEHRMKAKLADSGAKRVKRT